MVSERSRFICGDMLVRYLQEGEQVGLSVIPADMEGALTEKKCRLEPLVQVKLVGDAYANGFSQGRTMRDSATTRGSATIQGETFVSQQAETDDRGAVTVVTALRTARGVRLLHRLRYLPGTQALSLDTEVVNDTAAEETLEMLSSFTLGGLTPFDPGDAPDRLVLHRLRSSWSAEGRPCAESIESLGLERSWMGSSANALRFGQVGSLPVRDFVPEMALEDTASGVTWAVQLTHASSWQLEACRRDDGLSLSGGLADRELGHWLKRLDPGDSFRAPEVFLTVVRGGRDTAFQRLTEMVRPRLNLPAREKGMPILFNEFCTTWGRPSAEKLARLARALKGHGLDTLVIDAGWYADDGVDWQAAVGDWQPSRTLFPAGMDKTVADIKACGLHAGLWFEFEVCARGSALFEKREWLLRRDGVPIQSGGRRFLDMRRAEVRDYLRERVIGLVRRLGVEYVKVDYNESIGIGAEGTESLGETLRAQIEATQAFFDELRAAVPELTLEVCASGGHRLSPSFLQRCAMASFSDAHECPEIPIIAANMHRMILPRQSQIWAVIQPEMDSAKLRLRLVSAMLGRLCLSGNMAELTAAQWAVLDEGMDFYRAASEIIDLGRTTFLTEPIPSLRHPKGVQAVSRSLPDGRTLLVVHTFADCPERVTLPLDAVDRVYAEGRVKTAEKDGCVTLTGLRPFDGVAILGRLKLELDKT